MFRLIVYTKELKILLVVLVIIGNVFSFQLFLNWVESDPDP